MKKLNTLIIALMVSNVAFANQNQELVDINKYVHKKLIALQDIVFPDRRAHEEEIPLSKEYPRKWYWSVTLLITHGEMLDGKDAGNKMNNPHKCFLSFDRSENPIYPKPFIIPKGTEISIKNVLKGDNAKDNIYHIPLLNDQNQNYLASFWCTVNKHSALSINDFQNAIDGIFELSLSGL